MAKIEVQMGIFLRHYSPKSSICTACVAYDVVFPHRLNYVGTDTYKWTL